MDLVTLACGDSKNTDKPITIENDHMDRKNMYNNLGNNTKSNNVSLDDINKLTPQMIDDNEATIKGRIAQCKTIIDSLKWELKEEKSKLESETKVSQTLSKPPTGYGFNSILHDKNTDLNYSPSCANVDSKLNCDENLLEYEKQLEKYQNTLNMAQIEKKNAIRRQMLAKAYKLKLLEVENQCNIELLRVKQSLQCLEPLKMMAKKWKTQSNDDFSYNLNEIELMPRYPELSMVSSIDIRPTNNEKSNTNDKQNASDNDESKSSDSSTI